MYTWGWCKSRTVDDWPANYSVCRNSVKRREWKFAKIRGCLQPGTMFSPMHGANEKEAKEMESLKM